jgi:hypothetical protein
MTERILRIAKRLNLGKFAHQRSESFITFFADLVFAGILLCFQGVEELEIRVRAPISVGQSLRVLFELNEPPNDLAALDVRETGKCGEDLRGAHKPGVYAVGRRLAISRDAGAMRHAQLTEFILHILSDVMDVRLRVRFFGVGEQVVNEPKPRSNGLENPAWEPPNHERLQTPLTRADQAPPPTA